MILTGETESLGDSPVQVATTLSTTNTTWSELDTKPGLRVQKPATKPPDLR
jgi:hypothetical protein